MPNKDKYELLKDVNWAIKNILGFDTKSEYRKSKLFSDEE
jgi:hypothetical protein